MVDQDLAGTATATASSGEDQGTLKQVASEAAGQAQQAVGSAKGRVSSELDTRTTQVGQQVSSTAEDLRSMSELLRNQDRAPVAGLVEQAATRIEGLGRYLQDADTDRMLGDLEDMARRQPWLVAAGCFALGLAAARVVKASGVRRYTQRTQMGVRSQSSVGTPSVPVGTPPVPAPSPTPAVHTGPTTSPAPPVTPGQVGL